MTIKAVFFDVGGTLVDEARMFQGWATWLGVSATDFAAAVGATIEAREPHSRAFDIVAPGVDMPALRQARAAANDRFRIEPRDLYPDAAPCIAACKAAGLVVGIAGNQPAEAEAALEACGLGADHLAASDRWGVSKPDSRFFTRVAETCGLPPEAIAYVGDRVDNDVIPAHAAGMAPIFLTRGPWGVIQSRWPEARLAAATVRDLRGLPGLLAGL